MSCSVIASYFNWIKKCFKYDASSAAKSCNICNGPETRSSDVNTDTVMQKTVK